MLVGTCGAYDSSIAIGRVVVSRRVVLADPGVAGELSAYPDPMSTELVADAALGEALRAHGAQPTDVATTLAVTTDDPLAGRLSAFTRCGAEHLEAYGVAVACAAQGVPFVALLGVANGVGSRGRDEWRQNHRAASAAAIAVLLAWLGAGAPGHGAR